MNVNPETGDIDTADDGIDWHLRYRCVALYQEMARRDAREVDGKRGRARREAAEEAQRSADDARQLLDEFLADAFAVAWTGRRRERWEA